MKNIIVEMRIEPYKTFFDHKWSDAVLEKAKGSTIYPLVFDLMVAWRGCANTHCLPWIMVHSLKTFGEEFVKNRKPPSLKLLDALSDRVEYELGHNMNLTTKKKHRQVVTQLAQSMRDEFEQNPETIDVQEVWDQYFTEDEFRMSLWGSQRLAYGGVYYAYEDAVIRCYKAVKKITDYRIRDNEFKKDFTAAYNRELLEYCWIDDKVQVARIIRHALVHNGGRVTKDLANRTHDIEVLNGELQIMPTDTKELFDHLKHRATRLVEETLTRV